MSETPFQQLTPSDFEYLCRALLAELGFQRLQWRQGGRDRGRDIVAEFLTSEPDGVQVIQRWFVECKHHSQSNPLGISDLLTKVAWADAEQPDFLLFLTTSYLTPDAKDWVASIEKQKRFRLRYWEGVRITELIRRFPEISEVYLTGRRRTERDGLREMLLRKRLEDLEAHVANDSSIEVEEILGDPPDRYIMVLHCDALARFTSEGEPVVDHKHRVAFSLPQDYPAALPQVRVLTPIVHPHIYHNGLVCYGFNNPMDSLYIFVKKIQQLVSYKGVDFHAAVNLDPRLKSYVQSTKEREEAANPSDQADG